MNANPVANPSDAFTVIPVADYEPPTQDVPHTVAQCRQSPRPALRRRSSHAPPRSYTGQPSRAPAPDPGAPMSPRLRQAAVFADAALRRVLEVIDRRRPAAQLNPLLLSDALRPVPTDVPGDFSPACRMADMNRIFQIEDLGQFREIVGVGIQVVTVPRLGRTPMPSTIVSDRAIAARCQKESEWR